MGMFVEDEDAVRPEEYMERVANMSEEELKDEYKRLSEDMRRWGYDMQLGFMLFECERILREEHGLTDDDMLELCP